MDKTKINIEKQQKSWRRRTDLNAVSYFGTLAIFLTLNIIFTVYNPYKTAQEEQETEQELKANQTLTEENFGNETMIESEEPEIERPFYFSFFKDGHPGSWMQLYACLVQLSIIVGLCLDNGKSFTSRYKLLEKYNV